MKPSDAVELALARLEDLDDEAVFTARPSAAELRAAAAEVEARPGAVDLPLYGHTVAVKDNIDVAGLPTTAGCPWPAAPAGRDAAVVELLVAAGAVVVGKTNLDQLATGLTGTRSPFGTPRNPIDPTLVPGGSSSGSAVAVATGVTTLALGTDTAGSGRLPAGMCGVVGLKPTRGLISTRGLVPACPSLDCVSLFAATVADAAAALDVTDRFDPADPWSRPLRDRTRRPPDQSGRPARIGVPGPELAALVSDDVAAAFASAVSALAAAGVALVPIDLGPLLEAGRLLYEGPWIAERVAAFGALVAAHVGEVQPVVVELLGRASGLTAADAFAGMHRLRRLAVDASAIWAAVDAVVLPTVARHLTVAEAKADELAASAELGRLTNFVNLLDLCALAVPAGTTPAGRPSGLTFVAPALADDLLVELAATAPPAAASLGAPGPANRDPAPGRIRVAVAGAHLDGQPLNHQLTDRGARLVARTTTAPIYRFFALATSPPKPGLVRVHGGGHPIEVEVWELDAAGFGELVASVPAPMCIGSVVLADGTQVPGFLCEPGALDGAADITETGGWRAHLAAIAGSGGA